MLAYIHVRVSQLGLEFISTPSFVCSNPLAGDGQILLPIFESVAV
jgi:hypothetical protein